MPERDLSEVIDALERFAAAEDAWGPLEAGRPELRERAAWLRDQLGRVPAPLVAVLFGGTGTGKSTLLNALAGARIAETGAHRPTTEEPTVYHPPGIPQDFGAARYVQSDRLGDLVLVDTPDTDSIRTEHCARVEELLERADVVLFCATQQKYKNEKSLALLRPLRDERKVVCIQTRADEDADIRDDWLERLRSEGFRIEHCFHISAEHALHRKLGDGPAGDEFEFGRLEEYLDHKLPPERRSIKEDNLAGAVRNTLDAAAARVHGRDAELGELLCRLESLENGIGPVIFSELQDKLLSEGPAWVAAFGEAVSEGAFGLVGTLYRILHWLRMAPSRVIGKLSLAGLLQSSLRSSGSSEAGGPGVSGDDVYLRHVSERFTREHAEANAYLSRAGFDVVGFDEWQRDFVVELRGRLEERLGPVRERMARRARLLTRWLLPVLELLWFVPFLYTVGSPIVHYYWNLVRYGEIVLPETDFLARSAAMLGVVVLIELAAFAYLVRWSGRRLRARSRNDLAKVFVGSGFGFAKQRGQVERARERLDDLEALRRAVSPSG